MVIEPWYRNRDDAMYFFQNSFTGINGFNSSDFLVTLLVTLWSNQPLDKTLRGGSIFHKSVIGELSTISITPRSLCITREVTIILHSNPHLSKHFPPCGCFMVACQRTDPDDIGLHLDNWRNGVTVTSLYNSGEGYPFPQRANTFPNVSGHK